jgi:hypothetical protein
MATATFDAPVRKKSGEHTRLTLPQVTLCAVTSVNVAATLRALNACLAQIEFAGCKLFTDVEIKPAHPEITVVPIRRLESARDYSRFMLAELVEHVQTSHCLVVQWDGHVLDARRWRPAFLDYDYIGASWPHFDDGREVGNGGFSLRSRHLMEACRDPAFVGCHPEDLAIGRTNRAWLEKQGLRFAPRELADAFSAERAGSIDAGFGYHGVFNMPAAIGADAFWDIYRELDDRTTVWHDLGILLREMGRGPRPLPRSARMIVDRLSQSGRKKNQRK